MFERNKLNFLKKKGAKFFSFWPVGQLGQYWENFLNFAKVFHFIVFSKFHGQNK